MDYGREKPVIATLSGLQNNLSRLEGALFSTCCGISIRSTTQEPITQSAGGVCKACSRREFRDSTPKTQASTSIFVQKLVRGCKFSTVRVRLHIL